MLNNLFDHVYLINLDRRTDRLSESIKECKKINLTFERFSAIDGREHNLIIQEYPGYKQNAWNAGALGLLETTIKIIKDAKSNNYKSILILEDDILFHPQINDIVAEFFCEVPATWEMIQFGSQHIKTPKSIGRRFAILRGAYCLHCYAVNSNVYDLYLELLERRNKQIDWITAFDIHPRNNSYCISPNFAYQRANFSDIANTDVNYTFLK